VPRRLAPAVLAAWLLLLTAPASADDHLMRVNELKLSTGGDPTAQWVELIDSNDEGGPFGPYELKAFDGSGAPAGEQQLPGVFDGEDTAPYLVAHDNANIPGRDAQLIITMPTGSGQVCFSRANDTPIHCVVYGCAAATFSPLGGTQIGRAPSDLESLQRGLGSSLFLGAPTPDAPNTATTSAACAGSGGGPGGGGPGGGSGGDGTSPTQGLSFRRTQDIDRLAVAVRLNEAAALTVGGSVNVPGRSRVFRFRTVRRNVAAGVRTVVRLRLRRAGLRAAKRYMRRSGRRLTARVRITARDAAGNRSTRSPRIRLRR
jgi:hypothetical protein